MERVEEIILTKEKIDELLSKNTRNRHLSIARSKVYADNFKKHGFKRIGSIVVSDKGELADGQHRLMALKMAEIFDVPTTVLLDATEETIRLIDTNRPRRGGDILKIEGAALSTSQIGAINYDLKFDFHKFYLTPKAVQPYETYEHYKDKWEEIFEQMPLLISNFKNVPVSLKLNAAHIYAIGNYGSRVSYDRANDFLAEVINGGDKTSPAVRLREFIMVTTGRFTGKTGAQEAIRKSVYCINAHYKGVVINKLVEAKKWEIDINKENENGR